MAASNVRLDVLPDDRWAAAVAADLGRELIERPALRLCLPTGDTPSPMYDRLVELLNGGDASLADTTIVLLDEYVGLGPTDPARCDARLRRELLDRVAVAPRAFHSIPVDEMAPDDAAAAHDAIAARGLDLVLLGLGMNGHVGLNEPGSTAQSGTRVAQLTGASRDAAMGRYGAASLPAAGITLGMDRILEAGAVWLLVTGSRKADVVQRALSGPIGPDCPASFLRRHPRLRVVVDESAARSGPTAG